MPKGKKSIETRQTGGERRRGLYDNLTEESPMISQPEGMKVRLHLHQRTAVAAMMEMEEAGAVFIEKPGEDTLIFSAIKNNISGPQELNESTFVVRTNNGFLCDDVGAGKSLTALALIVVKRTPPLIPVAVSKHVATYIEMLSPVGIVGTNLIIVPENIPQQWGEEAKKTPLKHIVLVEEKDLYQFCDEDVVPLTEEEIYKNQVKTMKKGTYLTAFFEKIRGKGADKYHRTRYVVSPSKVARALKKYDVIIISVKLYPSFSDVFENIKWARVIVDEKAAMNNTRVRPFGQFRWFLTATPNEIWGTSGNSSAPMISGLGLYASPDRYPQIFQVRNNPDFVKKSTKLPKPIIYFVKTETNRLVRAVVNHLPTDIMQLINAGDMEGAIRTLGCNTESSSNIVSALSSRYKHELQVLKEKRDGYRRRLKIANGENEFNKLNDKIGRVRIEIAKKNEAIKDIEDKITECLKTTCWICADNFKMPTVMNCCKQVFCFQCLMSGLTVSESCCPYCREKIKKDHKGAYTIIQDKEGSESRKKSREKSVRDDVPFESMGKLAALDAIFKQVISSKKYRFPRFLLFSNCQKTFENVVDVIRKNGLTHAQLKGNNKSIIKTVNAYNKGKINVLNADAKGYGAGMNFPKTDVIIIYLRMMPTAEACRDMEEQIVGRGQRVGRNSTLRVVYIINDTEPDTCHMTQNTISLERTSDLWKLTDLACHPDEESDENLLRDEIHQQRDMIFDEDEESEKEPLPAHKSSRKAPTIDDDSASEIDEDEDDEDDESDDESDEESDSDDQEESAEESEEESDNDDQEESDEESEDDAPKKRTRR